MATKQEITKLIREYYATDMIIKDVVIHEEKMGNRTVHITDQLAALKWNIKKPAKDEPDIETTNNILDKRRQLKAQQLFAITKRVLRLKQKKNEWDKIWRGQEPDVKDSHEKLMDYTEGALYFLDVITPYEYEVQEPLMDEQGILLGNKLQAKESQDYLKEALQ